MGNRQAIVWVGDCTRSKHEPRSGDHNRENNSSFEDRMLRMMGSFSKRLNQLMSKVESNNGAGTTVGLMNPARQSQLMNVNDWRHIR